MKITNKTKIYGLVVSLMLMGLGIFLVGNYVEVQYSLKLAVKDQAVKGWKKFESQRVDFALKHPEYWDVSVCEDLVVYNQYAELISFSPTCLANATSESFGYVAVENQKIPLLSNGEFDFTGYFEYHFGYQYSYEQVKIGNKQGYRIIRPQRDDSTIGGNLGPPQNDQYIVYDTGKVYLIGLTNPNYKGDSAQNMQVFQQILNTMYFGRPEK